MVDALVLFVVAAVLGLLTNEPREYREAELSELDKYVHEWDEPRPIAAARHDAELTMEILSAARRHNRWKAGFLSAGVMADALAVTCVAATVSMVLMEGPAPWEVGLVIGLAGLSAVVIACFTLWPVPHLRVLRRGNLWRRLWK